VGTLKFLGSVLPDKAGKVNFPRQEVTLHPVGKPQIVTQTEIVNSQLSVALEAEGLSLADPMAFQEAIMLARNAVNSLAFIDGIGLIPIIDRVINENGEEVPVLHGGIAASGLRPTLSSGQVLKLLIEKPGIRPALNDLILAWTIPSQAPVNFMRAVEGMREYLFPTGTDSGLRKKAWNSFNAALRVDSAYTQHIASLSVPPRHGAQIQIPEDQATEAAIRTVTLISRSLWLIHHGLQELPDNGEFPFLRG
jgi:hypothetical protein